MPIVSSAKVRRGSFRPSATRPRDTAADKRTISFLVQSKNDVDPEPKVDLAAVRERISVIERELATVQGTGRPETGKRFVVFDAGASTVPDWGEVLIEGLDAPVEFVGFIDDFTVGGGLQIDLPEPGGYGKFYPSRKSKPSSKSRSSRLGTVKWFNSAKGYAFIHPDDGGKDVFVQLSAVELETPEGLVENQRVSIEVSPKGATKVTPVRRT